MRVNNAQVPRAKVAKQTETKARTKRKFGCETFRTLDLDILDENWNPLEGLEKDGVNDPLLEGIWYPQDEVLGFDVPELLDYSPPEKRTL